MKILGKFLLLAVGIAALFMLLLQVNWVGIFEIKQNQERLEKKLGKLVLDQVVSKYEKIEDDAIDNTLDSIFIPLLKENNISVKNYELFLIKNEEVNAFALPDDKIIITTGLINFLDSADYLAAILAHEIAHCEENHVMKSLVTNFGLDLLLSGSGTGEVTNFITGQAFSRKLEKEADEKAIDYLDEASIDPVSLAHVMELFDAYLTSDTDVTWISSHPAPADRSKYISQKVEKLDSDDKKYITPVTMKTWNDLKEKIELK